MCGRFAITLPPEAMRRLFAFEEQPNFPARYNIAPTQPIPFVHASSRDGQPTRRFGLGRWAFVPGFVKDPRGFPLLFNARAEGLADKASLRNALRRRRCLVPADAFYEWHRSGTGTRARSQPYLCRRREGTTMALAGLYETWVGPNGEEVDTVCIITTGANAVSERIHPRLPAIIEPSAFATWLDPDERSTDAALSLLVPAGDDILCFVPIGEMVNRAANDMPEIMAPVGPPLTRASRPTPARSLFDA